MRKRLIVVLFTLFILMSIPTTVYADIQIGQGSIPGSQNKQDSMQNSPEPPMSVTVYEDENCQINFSKVDISSGSAMMKFRVVNYTNRILTFQSDCMAINGESIENVSGSDDISPNGNGTINFKLRDYDEEYFDFQNIQKISGNITIIDFNDSNFHNGSRSYSINFVDVIIHEDAEVTVAGDQGQNFYNDNNVDFSYLKTDFKDGKAYVWFRVQNKTTDVITIQCDSLCLNGESSTKSSGSESIAPHSTGNIAIKCEFDWDYVDLNNITSLSGQLSVIDFQNDNFYEGRRSYKVLF